MRKRHWIAVAVALVAAALALVAVRPALSAAAAPVRIMPLGDSITGSPGCWRSLLWNRLQSTGYTNIDFVGTLPPQGCAVAHDGDNEGHGGILATNMASQNQLPPWLAATNPDIILMHLGTNDVWSNRSPQTILDAFTVLLNQMRAKNPSVRLLVAKILPMNPSTCAECAARTVAFNDSIPGWAAAHGTTQSPIIVVDQWTGFNTATDTNDGVHPNASGDQKMSDKWYTPLTNVLNGVLPTAGPTPTGGPTPTPTRTAGPTPTGVPTGVPGACTASYAVTNQWQGGFQAEVTVRNGGTSTLSGWVVRWTYANGQQVSQSWNGTVTQSGTAVTARPVAWNSSVPAGGSVTFGFIGSGDGGNPAPAPSCASS